MPKQMDWNERLCPFGNGLFNFPWLQAIGRGIDIRERAGLIGAVLGVWLAGNLVATFLVILPRNERAETTRDAHVTTQSLLGRKAMSGLL